MKKLLLSILIALSIILTGCISDDDLENNLNDVIDTIETIDTAYTSEELTPEEIVSMLDDSFTTLTEKEMKLSQYYEDYLLDDYVTLLPTDNLTITEGGVYLLEGTYNSTITINALDQDVDLILNNATIISTSGPAILVLEADDVTISSPEGTINTLSDSVNHPETVDLEDYNATIYSKSDLVFNGSGTLNIEAYYNNAINGKDDVKILEVTMSITSVDDGIIGKDSVCFNDATIIIDAIGDGIVSSNEEDINKGYIYIASGTFDLTVGNDAIQALNEIFIYDGTFTINSLDNGIQSDASILIGGGTFDIDSASDGINATVSLKIYDGDFTINADDDAIHSDLDLTIDGGTISIESSYEGIEALNIYINGGTISVNSTDDGINATTGGGQEHGPQYVSTGGTLTITGGLIVVSSQSDGVDVNGSATMSGGYLIVNGPTTDTQSAIDYDLTFDISGGVIVSLGSTGMILPMSSTSTQASLIYAGTTTYSAGTTVSLLDNDGNVLISINSLKSFAGVVISTPTMTTGETYTLELDDDSYEFTITSTVTSLGSGGSTPIGGLPPRR